jgi:hypothetical protein
VVIGSGNVAQAKAFSASRGVPFRVLTDPSRRSFDAAGMKRDLWATLHPGVLGNAVRALRGGFVQGLTQGDPWQQGGVLVVRPGGELVWSYLSEAAGDHPEVDAVLDVLRGG